MNVSVKREIGISKKIFIYDSQNAHGLYLKKHLDKEGYKTKTTDDETSATSYYSNHDDIDTVIFFMHSMSDCLLFLQFYEPGKRYIVGAFYDADHPFIKRSSAVKLINLNNTKFEIIEQLTAILNEELED
ncbi:hypothetical protein [Leptobacterium sp. I13]|uniref:hypothetical protein n=1 Tax=Leptobacterium meishanense TaxID=3128904 RepID=UPI0030EB9232